ncbi:kinesin light chain, partial [Aulographum hederae CBS 113979]
MAAAAKQLCCTDYRVAWICPLCDVELLPACLMLDEEHQPPAYNTHYDENTYIFGIISGHAVVIATCPSGLTGNVNAGKLTGSMFKTFPNIKMALLVGIGGGVPYSIPREDPLQDIHLGDVVVGWPGDGKPAVVYYDSGRWKGDGQYEMLGTVDKPEWRLTSALTKVVIDHKRGKAKFQDHLSRLSANKEFQSPGIEQDRLYKSRYNHVGERNSRCSDCDSAQLVERPKRTEDQRKQFVFHQGRIATGNSVIRDGVYRDQISERCSSVLCIEMEAAGIDVNGKCLVIRGIADYADSHKGDLWKNYAAGNAAVFARELLCKIQPAQVMQMEGSQGTVEGIPEAPWLVPFAQNATFVGREADLEKLAASLSLSATHQRLAIWGLGGCGKSAIAIEYAYRTRGRRPSCAVFWVPAISRESFEKAYRDIGTLLRIPGIGDDNADVKLLVREKLSNEDSGEWLMIIDNADDTNLLFDKPDGETKMGCLIDYLPHSRRGSVLFTTRTRKAAVRQAESTILDVGLLSPTEAKDLLRKRLISTHQKVDERATDEFLGLMGFLALAIVQAVAYINANSIPVSSYVDLYKDTEEIKKDLLGRFFEDSSRYPETNKPVATTWFISFEQIQRNVPLAADYMSFMACIARESIPRSLLPYNSSKLQQTDAIGTLTAYAFITHRKEELVEEDTFDMHRLIHLTIQGWLKLHHKWATCVESVRDRLEEVIPYGGHKHRETWTGYLPHAMYNAAIPLLSELEVPTTLLYRLGKCQASLGQYGAAEVTFKQVLALGLKRLGKEHPDTLTSVNNVALALSDQGKHEEAERMHR